MAHLLDERIGLRGILGLSAESAAFLRIDLMRFIASMGIVMFHYSSWFGIPASAVGGLQLFVISGIIISQVYSEKVGNLREMWSFFVARLARLAPLHWLLTGTYVLLGLMAGITGVTLNAPEKYDPSCLPAVITFTHALGGCDKLVYNFVSWSISAEIAMYAAFPLLVWTIMRSRLTMLGCFGSVIIGLYIFDWGWWERTYDFGVLRALPGFLFGMLLYRFRGSLKNVKIPAGLFGPVLLALIVAMIIVPTQAVVVLFVYVVVAIVYVMDLGGPPGRVIRYLSPLGLLTYSSYMLHPMFQTVFLSLVAAKILHLQGGWLGAFAIGTLCLLIAASYLSYRWIETPSRRVLRRVLSPSVGHQGKAT